MRRRRRLRRSDPPMPPPPPEPTPPPPVASAAPMAPEAPARPRRPEAHLGRARRRVLLVAVQSGPKRQLAGRPQQRAFDMTTNSATLALRRSLSTRRWTPCRSRWTSATARSARSSMGSTLAVRRATGRRTFIILQAYGNIAVLPVVTLDFGKFGTTAGAEVVAANKNWLYSRSNCCSTTSLCCTPARAPTSRSTDAPVAGERGERLE